MIHRTRIKICGLTRPQDVDAVVDAGADALGIVFYAPSKRYVDLDRAVLLRRRVPAFVQVVALFVNPQTQWVRQVEAAVAPDLLQFHGNESPAFCAQFSRPYLKAFAVGGPGYGTAAQLAGACRLYRAAAGWLFDSHSAGYGGSGRVFDLALLADIPRGPGVPAVILSGGLTAQSVARRIAACDPFGVDVSSGVEIRPGVKDADRIRAFVSAVREQDVKRGLAIPPSL